MPENVRPLFLERAVVVGGSGNLGPIWIETLKELGASVEVMDLPDWDVTGEHDARGFLNAYMRANGHVPTIVVYNAAIDNPPKSKASFFGNVDEIINVNLLGAVRVTDAFIAHMMDCGGGTFIYIGSIMGNIGADWRNYGEGFEKPVGYNLSKAALIQLARSVTTQYGHRGIRACTLAFGPYDNGQLTDDFKGKFLKNVPLQRTISRESFKSALRFACTCPELAGQQVLVDGGYCAF